MTIDWSKAPEGATHLTLPNSPNQRPVFWRVANGIAREAWPMENDFSVVRDHFRYGADGCASFIDWLAIPKPAPWNGEGLPPVGTVCEIQSHQMNDWSPATIKFASRNVIVWDWDAEPALNGLCTSYAHAIKIRPIRTAEQIAADERLHKVRNALTAIKASRHFPGDEARQNVMVATVEAMIDAGFVQQVAQ